jgi:hypothetical protein
MPWGASSRGNFFSWICPGAYDPSISSIRSTVRLDGLGGRLETFHAHPFDNLLFHVRIETKSETYDVSKAGDDFVLEQG